MLAKALAFSHTLLSECIQAGDTVLDATIGNGYDTLFLAELVGKNGTVYGFDIQEQALISTRTRLAADHVQASVKLIKANHADAVELLPKTVQLKAVIFNLGYLPSGDKSIVTQAASTISAMHKLLPCLVAGGRMIFVVYYGHPGGEQEKVSLLAEASCLPQTAYDVLTYQFINQKNQPPFVIAIEKK